MSENVRLKWTKKLRRAAQLLASGKMPETQIAEELGVNPRTLYRWRQHPEFAAEVEQIVASTAAALQAKGIAEKQNRIDALNERWRLMQQVIAERAELLRDVPGGGSTGLLVRQVKAVRISEDGPEPIEEYRVDTALLKEMRETERQAAQELDQWVERRDVTSKGEQILTFLQLAQAATDGNNSSKKGSQPGAE